MEIIPILKKMGLSDNEVKVYLGVLELGPSSVRKIAEHSGVNRGTCYDILKNLISEGLAGYFHKDKHQYFMAENPEKLVCFLEEKKKHIESLKSRALEIIPMLKSVYDNAGSKPVVRFYEGDKAAKIVLEDLLDSLRSKKNEDRKYVAYSSMDIRPYLYQRFENFTKLRIKSNINVRVISFGAGGENVPLLAQRKWLSRNKASVPNYILVYAGKMAVITMAVPEKPVAVLIEDKSIFDTQMILFDSLWKTIK